MVSSFAINDLARSIVKTPAFITRGFMFLPSGGGITSTTCYLSIARVLRLSRSVG